MKYYSQPLQGSACLPRRWHRTFLFFKVIPVHQLPCRHRPAHPPEHPVIAGPFPGWFNSETDRFQGKLDNETGREGQAVILFRRLRIPCPIFIVGLRIDTIGLPRLLRSFVALVPRKLCPVHHNLLMIRFFFCGFFDLFHGISMACFLLPSFSNTRGVHSLAL